MVCRSRVGPNHRAGCARVRIPGSETDDRVTMTGERIGVLLLISGLDHGGAQRQVVELAKHLDRKRFAPVVCSLSEDNPLADGLSEAGLEIIVAAKRWRFDPTAISRVARIMAGRAIRVVQTFLFDAEIVGRIAGRIARVPVVLGSERNSNYERPGLQKWCLRLTRGWSDGIVANSRAGRQFTVRTQGVDEDRVHLVPNGVDVQRFRPVDATGFRAAHGLAPEDALVGMVASFKPQKNHLMFVRVAQRVAERLPAARFCFVGGELADRGKGMLSMKAGAGFHQQVGDYHRQVLSAITDSGLDSRCLFLGNLENLCPVYNACDVTVLTSRHEGTPNVLLESMACEVPVVATDVADNAAVVPEGRTGFIVGLDDDAAMAARVCRLLDDAALRRRMGSAGRAWVEQEYSTSALARRTEALYLMLLRKHAAFDRKTESNLPVERADASRSSAV